MIAFAQEHRLARLALDDGYGAQTMWEPEPVTITLSGTPVALPHGAFLQATAEGEAALVEAVRAGGRRRGRDRRPVRRARHLRAGLAGQSLCGRGRAGRGAGAEGGRARRSSPSIATCSAGRSTRPSSTASKRSCSIRRGPGRGSWRHIWPRPRCPGSLTCPAIPTPSRGTRGNLIDGGYRLDWIKPVGQFRWSTHVELAAAFVRP